MRNLLHPRSAKGPGMFGWIKPLFRKPTTLERAAQELWDLEHATLDATAEMEWARHRINYQQERMTYLKTLLLQGGQQ